MTTKLQQQQQQDSKQYVPSNTVHHGTTTMHEEDCVYKIPRLEFSNGKLFSKTEKPKSKRKTIAKTRMKNSLQHYRFSFLAALYVLFLIDSVSVFITKLSSQTLQRY